jgi:hypothetical protein
MKLTFVGGPVDGGQTHVNWPRLEQKAMEEPDNRYRIHLWTCPERDAVYVLTTVWFDATMECRMVFEGWRTWHDEII